MEKFESANGDWECVVDGYDIVLRHKPTGMKFVCAADWDTLNDTISAVRAMLNDHVSKAED